MGSGKLRAYQLKAAKDWLDDLRVKVARPVTYGATTAAQGVLAERADDQVGRPHDQAQRALHRHHGRRGVHDEGDADGELLVSRWPGEHGGVPRRRMR